jgi:hypothetical protein
VVVLCVVVRDSYPWSGGLPAVAEFAGPSSDPGGTARAACPVTGEVAMPRSQRLSPDREVDRAAGLEDSAWRKRLCHHQMPCVLVHLAVPDGPEGAIGPFQSRPGGRQRQAGQPGYAAAGLRFDGSATSTGGDRHLAAVEPIDGEADTGALVSVR